CLVNALCRVALELGRTKIITRPSGVLSCVIISTFFRSHFNHWKGFASQNADGGFTAHNAFFHQDLGIVSERFGQGGAPITNAFDELQADTRALPHGLEDYGWLPAHRPTGAWRIKD